jgi:sterol desaturase/sphingolipid hydroxylase (fatty acid hydroxylase superfamily)
MCVGLYFGASPIRLVSMAAVGSYQTIVDHSGWNLPLNKDPIHHYLHHKYRKKTINNGLGPIEQLLEILVQKSNKTRATKQIKLILKNFFHEKNKKIQETVEFQNLFLYLFELMMMILCESVLS